MIRYTFNFWWDRPELPPWNKLPFLTWRSQWLFLLSESYASKRTTVAVREVCVLDTSVVKVSVFILIIKEATEVYGFQGQHLVGRISLIESWGISHGKWIEGQKRRRICIWVSCDPFWWPGGQERISSVCHFLTLKRKELEATENDKNAGCRSSIQLKLELPKPHLDGNFSLLRTTMWKRQSFALLWNTSSKVRSRKRKMVC